MSQNQSSSESSTYIPPYSYTVASLLSRAGFYSQNELFKRLDTSIRVQGIAQQIKPYNGSVYFTLAGEGHELRVKTPKENCPQPGEAIVVEGFLSLKVSSFFKGLELLLDGKPIANWQPVSEDRDVSVELVKASHLRLHDLIFDSGWDGLILVGSDTGIRDVLSQVPSDVRDLIQVKRIQVSKAAQIVSQIEAFIESTTEGVLIARGGDDDTMKIWDDPEVVQKLIDLVVPFYVALGHSHRTTLADQMADESFKTPTAMGTALASIIRLMRHLQHQKQQEQTYIQRISELENENKITKRLLEKHESAPAALEASGFKFNWMILALIALLAYIAFK